MDAHPPTSAAVLTRNTVINFAGLILPLMVGVAAIPLAIRGLGTEAFGILSIAWVVIGYLTLLDFGLSRATTKFTAEHLRSGTQDAIPSVMWTAVFVSFSLGCIGGLVLYLTLPWMTGCFIHPSDALFPHALAGFRVVACALPILLLSVNLKGMLGAAQRFDLVNAVHIPVTILNFIIPALSLPFGWKLPEILILMMLSRAAAAGCYFILCLRVFPGCRIRIRPTRSTVRRLLAYGGWVTVSGVVSPLLVSLDRFFIGSMLSVSLLTFYAAPLEAVMRLRVIPQSMMATVFPEFSAGLDGRRMSQLFWRSVKYILLVIGVISLVLFFFASDILRVWLGEAFAERSTTVFQIVSVSILINFLAIVPFTLLQGIGRPDIPAKLHLAELPFYILLLVVSIRMLGLVGAALAWGVRVTLDAVLLFLSTRRLVPQLLQDRSDLHCGRIALMLGLTGLLLFLIQRIDADLIFRSVCLVLILVGAGCATYRTILDDVEKRQVSRLIHVIPNGRGGSNRRAP